MFPGLQLLGICFEALMQWLRVYKNNNSMPAMRTEWSNCYSFTPEPRPEAELGGQMIASMLPIEDKIYDQARICQSTASNNPNEILSITLSV